MNSKTSCFNRTLLKSDIKRLWWTGALSAFAMFLCTTLPFLRCVKMEWNASSSVEKAANINSDFASFSYFGIICGMVTALCLSALLFAYMNRASSVSCIHGLPVSRKTLYFTHLLSGLILLAVPAVINVLFMLQGLTEGLTAVNLLKFVAEYVIYTLGILTVATLIGMLTGNTAAHIIFTVVAVLLPLFLVVFSDTVCSNNFYGYYNSENMYNFLLNYVYLTPDRLMSFRVLIYVAAILIFTLLGLFSYKKRGLENHGEVIAFPKLKWLFKLLFSFCAGVLGYFYVSSVWGIDNLLMLIPFAIVGLVIAHMLTQKSFTLKGIVPTLVTIIVINLGLFCVVQYDLIGFETRVPNVNNIKSVTFADISGNGNYYTYIEGQGTLKRAGYYIPKFTTPEEIKMFTDLQSYKIANRDYDNDGYGNIDGVDQNVCIQYTLKNGRKMYRSYYLSAKECDKYLRPIYETKTYLAYHYPVLQEEFGNVSRIEIDDVRNSEASALAYFKGSDAEAELIIEALKKDREDTTFEEYSTKSSQYRVTTISVTYYTDGIDEDGNLKKNSFKNVDEYAIDSTDVNTMALLNELRVFDNSGIENTDNLSSVSVRLSDIFVHGNYVDPYSYVESESEKTVEAEYADSTTEYTRDYALLSENTFTDKDSMENIFNYIFDEGVKYPFMSDSYIRMDITFTFKDGYSFNINAVSEMDSLPEVLSKVVNKKAQ